MGSTSTVYITDSSVAVEDDTVTNLSIQDVLEETSEEEYDEFMQTMRTAGVPTGTTFPLFDIFWKELVLPGDTSGSLVELYFVYRAVNNSLTDDIDEIVCNLSHQKYHRPVLDAAAPDGIPVVGPDGDPITLHTHRQVFATMLSIITTTIVLLVDMLLAMVVSLFSSMDTDISENPLFVFFPYPGRFESTKSVVNTANFQYLIALPSLVAGRLLSRRLTDYPFDKTPLLCASLRSLTAPFGVCHVAGGLLKELFGKLRGQDALVQHLSDEADASIPRSVRYAWIVGFRGKSRGLLTAKITETIYTRWDVKGVLVSGNSPRDRAFLYVARSHGVQTYYLPHSVLHSVRNIYTHHPETTMFLEGEFSVEYLKANRPSETLPDLVGLGRPYFETLLDYRQTGGGTSDEIVTITLATQDQPDRMREALARTVLLAIAEGIAAETAVRVIVKIHPNESPALYEQLQSDLSLDAIDDIEIRNRNLYSTLQQSDLIVTVNSNVGIESMIVGTPCACVVLFDPWMPVYPYARHESVPVNRTKDATFAFFQQLTPEELVDLQAEQRNYVSNSYVLEPDIGESIAEYIADDCCS
jgi:hypothetical protein